MTDAPEFTRLVDLAARGVGGGVVAANDELFAERENLIRDAPPTYRPGTFGHRGQVYDGWETRRRREPGADWAVVRLGLPGVVHGVVVDTAFFRGNYPPAVSVQGLAADGYPSPHELTEAPWEPLVPESPCAGDTVNHYPVTSPRRWTHLRLVQHPDGGVARFRVHGEVVADPRLLLDGTTDLAALENGARVTGCSNLFYSAPSNLIAPGEARTMGEGWETARRRDGGNDWVELALAGAGTVRLAELDTRYFVGNAPGWARLTGLGPDGEVELVARTRLQPDTRHRFPTGVERVVDRVRLDVYPDGGMARVRLWGALSVSGREALVRRFWETTQR